MRHPPWHAAPSPLHAATGGRARTPTPTVSRLRLMAVRMLTMLCALSVFATTAMAPSWLDAAIDPSREVIAPFPSLLYPSPPFLLSLPPRIFGANQALSGQNPSSKKIRQVRYPPPPSFYPYTTPPHLPSLHREKLGVNAGAPPLAAAAASL